MVLRYPWLVAFFALMCAVYLTTAACSDDDAQTGPVDSGELPSTAQGGTVPEDATIVFEGERYRVVSVHQRDTVTGFTDDYDEVGVIEDASVPVEGDVTVYRRSNDESAIYTGSLTPAEGGAEVDLLYRWQPLDRVEELEETPAPTGEGGYEP